jgi:hypothetical protein
MDNVEAVGLQDRLDPFVCTGLYVIILEHDRVDVCRRAARGEHGLVEGFQDVHKGAFAIDDQGVKGNPRRVKLMFDKLLPGDGADGIPTGAGLLSFSHSSCQAGLLEREIAESRRHDPEVELAPVAVLLKPTADLRTALQNDERATHGSQDTGHAADIAPDFEDAS